MRLLLDSPDHAEPRQAPVPRNPSGDPAKTSSARRLASSRANGAKSSGPITSEGKQRSSRNAITHGMLSETAIQDEENSALFRDLVQSFEDSLHPASPTAYVLIQNMAIARWRQLRAWAAETATFNKAVLALDPNELPMNRAAEVFRDLADNTRFLDVLDRYETRFDRQFARSLRLFHQINQLDPSENNFCQTNPVPPTDTPQPAEISTIAPPAAPEGFYKKEPRGAAAHTPEVPIQAAAPAASEYPYIKEARGAAAPHPPTPDPQIPTPSVPPAAEAPRYIGWEV